MEHRQELPQTQTSALTKIAEETKASVLSLFLL